MADKPRYYLTTAIAYPNGPPHIGHAYEAIATDAIARFMRLDGYDVLFVTGINRGDFRLSPRIDYLVSGAVTLSVGADLFEGPHQTLYGQFDRNDRVTFTTTWRF